MNNTRASGQGVWEPGGALWRSFEQERGITPMVYGYDSARCLMNETRRSALDAG